MATHWPTGFCGAGTTRWSWAGESATEVGRSVRFLLLAWIARWHPPRRSKALSPALALVLPDSLLAYSWYPPLSRMRAVELIVGRRSRGGIHLGTGPHEAAIKAPNPWPSPRHWCRFGSASYPVR